MAASQATDDHPWWRNERSRFPHYEYSELAPWLKGVGNAILEWTQAISESQQRHADFFQQQHDMIRVKLVDVAAWLRVRYGINCVIDESKLGLEFVFDHTPNVLTIAHSSWADPFPKPPRSFVRVSLAGSTYLLEDCEIADFNEESLMRMLSTLLEHWSHRFPPPR